MLKNLAIKTVAATTLPSRLMLRHSVKALGLAKLLPANTDAHIAQFQQEIRQLLTEIDRDFERNVAKLSASERAVVTAQEIQKAEHHLSYAAISMLRLIRLAIADGSLIEHDFTQHDVTQHDFTQNSKKLA